VKISPSSLLGWLRRGRKNSAKARHEQIIKLLTDMAKTAEELAADINAANLQLRKATDEILKRIQALIDAQTSGDLSAIETAVGSLKTAAQTLDDIVPDAPPVEPPPAP
jgi:uncharacterized protein YPO0396